MVSPVFKALKKLGYHVICHTGKRGMNVLEGNPNIDEFIEYTKEKEDNPNIEAEWRTLTNSINPDWVKNYSESLEVNIAMHPRSPGYVYPKQERNKLCNRNYYEVTAQWGDLEFDEYKPDLYISHKEFDKAKKVLTPNKFNIMWCLSGSGANKAYPWTDYVIGEVLKNHKDVHFITVGDEKCQILESMIDHENITNLSGKNTFRETMALTKVVDLVIAPDTGVLHASGAFDTPKIGILGHTTIENITKHFKNDYSLEADPNTCECSPCFRLIYDHNVQCPVDKVTKAAWCMAYGQDKLRMYYRICEVLNASRK